MSPWPKGRLTLCIKIQLTQPSGSGGSCCAVGVSTSPAAAGWLIVASRGTSWASPLRSGVASFSGRAGSAFSAAGISGWGTGGFAGSLGVSGPCWFGCQTSFAAGGGAATFFAASSSCFFLFSSSFFFAASSSCFFLASSSFFLASSSFFLASSSSFFFASSASCFLRSSCSFFRAAS